MGAIETVRINPDTLEPMIVTIGQQRAKGICGSGLIDAVAELFLTGVINEKGKFNVDLGPPAHPGRRAGRRSTCWSGRPSPPSARTSPSPRPTWTT